jgi:dihydroorotate dehydrogenase (fumarate)
MADLRTTWMGLSLPNPLIVGASGLTKDAAAARECESAGAGAIVLKSLFEEEIDQDVGGGEDAGAPGHAHPEAVDFIRRYGKAAAAERYLDVVASSRAALSIPVIASIHCVSSGSWTHYARKVQMAGASALELNLFLPPMDFQRSGAEIERAYLDIVREVRHAVSIPVALKIGPHFSGLAHFAVALSRLVEGLVLFNRFFRVDFDVERRELVPGSMLSDPSEIQLPLRWVSLLAGRVSCDLCASTGIHDGTGVLKAVMAGAKAAQVCSVLYEHGLPRLGAMRHDLEFWMDRHGVKDLESLRGCMSQVRSDDPASFERVQFMKVSTGIE